MATATDVELPASVHAMLHGDQPSEDRPAENPTHEKVAAIASVLRDDRKRCVDGRRLSGIEDVWRKCEDNYATVDEVTGATAAVVRPRFTKAPDLDGPIRRTDTTQAPTTSTVFERLTARYVDAATAKIVSVVLTANEATFSIKETPDPDLIKGKDDLTPVLLEDGQPALRDPKLEEITPPNPTDPLTPLPPDPTKPPSQMPGVPMLQKDLVEEKIETAHAKAEEAKRIIYDWMVEAKHMRAMRKVLHYAPKLGAGIMKGPFPELRRARSVSRQKDQTDPKKVTVVFQMKEELKAGFKSVSPWDFFPDPDCGDDIQSGRGVWERDYQSEKGLVALKDLPGYFAAEIDQVIKEGPGKKEVAGAREDSNILKDTRFEIWYFTGWLTREEALSINDYMGLPQGHSAHLTVDEHVPSISVIVTMVNDSMIRCTMNGLEKSGHYPYRVLAWTPREGHWCGVGVAEQVFMPQELVNSATRELVNNAGAGAQIVMARGMVEPSVKDDWAIYGNKLWFLKPEMSIDDVQKVFGVFSIPNLTAQMLEIILHAYRVAETSCNIPLVSQGMSGETTPETLGQTELQNTNANQLLLHVSGEIDESITKPNVEDLYEWLLLDTDVSDDAKGDFNIDARGASALMERTIQNQFLAQQASIVQNPTFGANPKKWYAAVLKGQHVNPSDIMYSKDEQQKIAAQPQPKAPQVEAAEIRSKTDLVLGKQEQDRDTLYVQAETERTQVDHEVKMQELQLKRELAMLQYANENRISIDQLKTELAMTTMKLSVQKELAARDHAVEALKPPTEPSGKAPAGQSWEK